MQETGYPAREKDGRKFQHESEGEVRSYSCVADPGGTVQIGARRPEFQQAFLREKNRTHRVNYLRGLDSENLLLSVIL